MCAFRVKPNYNVFIPRNDLIKLRINVNLKYKTDKRNKACEVHAVPCFRIRVFIIVLQVI